MNRTKNTCNDAKKSVVVSFRPKFASLLLSGDKRFEFRRAFASLSEGYLILVYASSRGENPGGLKKSCLVGSAVVASCVVMSVQDAWDIAKKVPGETKEEFFAYYEGTESATVIELVSVKAFQDPIHMDVLKALGVKPPVSWCNASSELFALVG